MPNQPKTPHLTIRCDLVLADAVRVKAHERGETITAVILRALREYVRE